MAQKDYSAARDDYMTPYPVYAPLLDLIALTYQIFPDKPIFDIDVCCTLDNIPAHKHFFNGVYDGLAEDWRGLCFLNPPFKYARLWIKKAIESVEAGTATDIFAVIPSDRLETKYYQEHILNNPLCVFGFLPGKVGFINPDEPAAEIIPSQKIMIAIFTKRPDLYKTNWNRLNLYDTTAFRGGLI